MRLLAFILIFFVSEKVFAQSELEQVWNDEISFAKMAKEVGTKPAFLHFLAKDALVFDENGPKNGPKFWQETEFQGQLTWQPKYLKISSGKDLAFTFGSFQYFEANSTNPNAKGSFVSVWQKQNDNSWKVKLDIGAFVDTEDTQRTEIKILNQKNFAKTDSSSLNAAILTSDFLLSTNLNKGRKVDSFSQNCIFIKQKEVSVTGFQPLGAIVSQSQDLAFIFGRVESPTKGNYLRVWERENRKKWKVVLEIISN
jgi:ketosteroid isomerase-like protein